MGLSGHSRPPHTPSSQQHPGVGRRLGRAVPAPGSPPRPPPRVPSCSSSPACVATPAWTGPAPTSGSRSGSWRAPSGRPAWTPEVGVSEGPAGPARVSGHVWLVVPAGFVPPALPCTPQGPPSVGSSRGSERPARAWTRRIGTPIRPTSSSTLPTRTTCPSTPRGAPSCPPPPAPHPLSAGIFQ